MSRYIKFAIRFAIMLLILLNILGCTNTANTNQTYKQQDRSDVQGGENSSQNSVQTYSTQNKWSNFHIGDIYEFGKYKQDSSADSELKTIKWIILENTGDKVMLISKYALALRTYDGEFNSTHSNIEDVQPVTWETCGLRYWLNNTFYNEAFSETEKQYICTTNVIADNNRDFSELQGKDTQDKVFLLSLKECRKYFSSEAERQCQMTPYACNGNPYKFSSDYGEYACWWWLRLDGEATIWANKVTTAGECGAEYNTARIDAFEIGVRPVIWLK